MTSAIRPPLDRQRFLAKIRAEPEYDVRIVVGGGNVIAGAIDFLETSHAS
jgi:uridylate kinase